MGVTERRVALRDAGGRGPGTVTWVRCATGGTPWSGDPRCSVPAPRPVAGGCRSGPLAPVFEPDDGGTADEPGDADEQKGGAGQGAGDHREDADEHRGRQKDLVEPPDPREPPELPLHQCLGALLGATLSGTVC